MNLRVIEGGRDTLRELTDVEVPGFSPRKADVRREADRRLKRLDYDRWRTRELATGIRMPRELRYLAMQIEFVAERLTALKEIPADYRADAYWPG
ncbi:hypothetical protein ABID21_003966 [Pseudorhizobium tarimense]|uniref:Uncharacterized protein n=1 Tax=Pseudorhizobium tarimense TaxID=1079109 RepID=A0ABV2HBA6_9HYPH|nr:hypothetical protein [Pseudorhizobium tarimense]MCJ8520744.1 hypothetical protein [Pseudorhizobium tarimense]